MPDLKILLDNIHAVVDKTNGMIYPKLFLDPNEAARYAKNLGKDYIVQKNLFIQEK